MTFEPPIIDRYDLIIFDLDGVVYLGSEPIPGAPEAIKRLSAEHRRMVYATNNAGRRPEEVAALLLSFGVPATPDEVITSPQAAARLLAGRLPAGAPVLVVGAAALRTEISSVGLTPVDTADASPSAVVQGYGPDVGWRMLAEACVAVRAGALWVATNADRTLPSPRGPLPGNGSLVAALSTALEREPDAVVGKPAPELFEQAAERVGARRAVVVGDRLDTDIEGASRAGMDSVLVLTGVSGGRDLLVAPAHQRPTFVVEDLAGLFALSTSTGGWRVAREGGSLTLSGDGTPVEALRLLSASSWDNGTGSVDDVRAADDRAREVLRGLGLDAA